ncbi:HD-GYP domain-containing protein [Brevibacillus sp. SYSU BS000544]|uniref:HD-GYP domain-containing protein n=1 Tax=Brevibacillus sp. SYSU BS000544 TaxID=3416443 RepID=UPI003CE55537
MTKLIRRWNLVFSSLLFILFFSTFGYEYHLIEKMKHILPQQLAAFQLIMIISAVVIGALILGGWFSVHLLSNHLHQEELHHKQMYFNTIRALSKTLEAKDLYTHGHSERVALLSREIARKRNLSERDILRIYLAGLVHDIGKVGIPSIILHKNDRLTDEEFAQIKKHPTLGVQILERIEELAPLIPAVAYHHERYDGKGYPYGLKEQEIPEMARIMSVADAFDAMTSDRPYRKAMPLEKAIQILEENAGTQFDPEVVRDFLSIMQNEEILHAFIETKDTDSFLHDLTLSADKVAL